MTETLRNSTDSLGVRLEPPAAELPMTKDGAITSVVHEYEDQLRKSIAQANTSHAHSIAKSLF